MPVETRATDTYTRDNLLLGFSQVYFTPVSSGGGYGTQVPLGILSGQELQKEIELLELERGDAGLIVVDREIVSKLTLSLQVVSFNFRKDLAEYIFASSTSSDVTADATAAITNEDINLPSTDPFETFIALDQGDINVGSFEVTCTEIEDEAVGTGDGSTGLSQGDFSLDYKIKAIGDVTSLTVAGSDFVTAGKIVAGSSPAADEVAVEIGEEDSPTSGSGSITFGAAPASGAAILATYTPSFTTTAGDIVSADVPAVEGGRSEVADVTTITITEPGGGPDLVTRAIGSWITDGFALGQYVTFVGTVSNDGAILGPIVSMSATVLGFPEGTLTAEGAVAADTVGIDNGNDFQVDPVLGKIRFLHAEADGSPFRLSAAAGEQPLQVDYTYNRKAHTLLSPFTRNQVEGKVSIKHLPEVGINFIWTVPYASIRITDDALVFDSADFATTTLVLNILNNGGVSPYGTLQLSSETEQLA
jgi:hypothetical protein